MENICFANKLGSYDFPPPQMKQGCIAFMGKHSDDIVNGLMKRNNNIDAEHAICYTITKACIDSEEKASTDI